MRKQFGLSDMQIQMARELGLSPKNFGRYANTENQPWKLPLAEFIEASYHKRFGKNAPDHVKSIEQLAAEHLARRAQKKAEKENASTATEASRSASPHAPNES